MKNLVRLLSLATISVALALGAIGTASAHAELDTSDPAADAVLAAAPAKVTLTFTEEIQTTSGSYDIAVTNASGASVTDGAATVGSDDMSLSVALKSNLPDGVYTVEWNNTSADDGDELSEEFSFTVGTAATPSTPVAHEDDDHEHEHEHQDEHEDAPEASGPFEPATVGFIAVAVTAQNGSGVSGRAEIVAVDGGAKTEIGLYLTGIAEGAPQAAHVHVASTCFEGAHAADLDNVEATASGYGRSVTTIAVPFSTVANGKHNILVHAGSSGGAASEQVVACAIIPAQPADSHPIALPQTGSALSESNSSATLVLIVVLLLVGTMITAGGAFSARRNG